MAHVALTVGSFHLAVPSTAMISGIDDEFTPSVSPVVQYSPQLSGHSTSPNVHCLDLDAHASLYPEYIGVGVLK